jgi:hypothetical protein
MSRGVAILRADAARDHGRYTHAKSDGYRVQHGDQRLCQPDGGDSVGTETGYKGDIDNRKHGFHRHLEHHWNGEQPERTADRPDCEVGLIVAQ